MPSRLKVEIEQQAAANASALPFLGLYAEHRQNLTREILRLAPDPPGGRLCILGAGNCYDVELPRLIAAFHEVHLVDIDGRALERARQSLPEEGRSKVTLHAPVDLSGMTGKLARWQRYQVTPDELMSHPEQVAEETVKQLGRFQVVVSACVLTQMQRMVLESLTDRHRLFPAIRHTLTVAHLRVLVALAEPGGRMLFASDLVASDHLDLSGAKSASDLKAIFEEVVRAGNVIFVAHPELLKAILRDDPVLRREASFGGDPSLWLWQQGPHRTFMVYAMELARRRAGEPIDHQRTGGT